MTTHWTEKTIPGVGRIRECPPGGFPATGNLRDLFRPGERRPRLRRPTTNGSLGGFLTVIDEDNRERRTDTQNAPLRMICSIEASDAEGKKWFGTGFMIGRRTVVTAAHVLFDRSKNLFATSAIVRPGRDVNNAPFGEHTVSAANWRLHPQWNDRQIPSNDISLLQLEEPVGEKTSWFGVAALSDAALAERMINIAGYPCYVGDRNAVPPEANRIPDGERSQRLYWHGDRILATDPDQLFYDVDTFAGQSGAPVILMPLAENPFSGPTVVGIHTRGVFDTATEQQERTHNSATRITGSVLDLIGEWVREKDAS